MQVTQLTLSQFRNYEHLSHSFGPGINVLFGNNAQGKTNILESLFLCCTGRSHRTTRDRELIRWGEQSARIELDLSRREGRHILDIRLGDSKTILINGTQATRIGQLMGHLNGVMFSPEDLRLVKEGPLERRRFIDMELSQTRPSYFYALQRYHRILLQRNRLLRTLQTRQSTADTNTGTLESWDIQIAETGASLISQRRLFVDEIARMAAEVHHQVSQQAESLTIHYRPGLPGFADKDILPDDIIDALQRERERDIQQAATSIGPHRDDLQLRLNGRDARQYASQGQQRSCALSMKLAQIQYMIANTGEAPILLLDDVMSELDNTRRMMLLTYIQNLQVFITTTDRTLPLPDGMPVFWHHVEQGKITS